MNQLSDVPNHTKRNIVQEELKELLQEGYISQESYYKILDAQDRYHQASKVEAIRSEKSEKQHTENESKEMLSEQLTHQQVNDADNAKNKPTENVAVSKQGPVKTTAQPQPKKKLTEQEIRERNITWLLGIGVVFLLIAGTFLATSTWYMLPDLIKTLFIVLVAGLFFGLALLTDKVLKIKKTGFAFYVLGSLFLPIIILSIGFYGQLGYYLSVYGEGKYLLGALGGLVLLPTYVLMARKLQSSLFIWFAYISLTCTASFLFGWLNFPIDGFYLGMVLFNTGLIFFYRYTRTKYKESLFIKNFVKYVQANLVLTSGFVILFYDNAIMNGFNVIITAALYLMMISVTNYRQYHYVFTLLFVYGAYQVIEFSSLREADAIFYALLGFVFLFIPKILRGEHQLTKVFQYTSVIVSGVAFLFISFKAMVLTMEEPSLVLSIAYLLIAFNFMYAANHFVAKPRLFGYISTGFIMVGLYELVLVGQELMGYESIRLPMYLLAFLMYVTFGSFIKYGFFENIRQASRDVSVLVMGGIFIIHSPFIDLWEMGMMFGLLSMTAVLAFYYEPRFDKDATKAVTWLHGLLFGAAIISFYSYFTSYFELSREILPTSAAVAGVIGLGLSSIWRALKKGAFYNSTFYAAHILYLIGMLQTLDLTIDSLNPMMRVMIYAVGLIMVYILYRKTKWAVTPYLMGTNVLALYLVTLYAAHQSYDLMDPLFLALQFTAASVLLFVLGMLFKEKHVMFRYAFWWVAHAFMPIALIMQIFSTDESVFWAVLATGMIYGISLYKTKQNEFQYIFLYSLLLSIALAVIYFILWIDWMDAFKYNLFMTIAVYIAIWFAVSHEWKARLKYYIAPFSTISLLIYTFIMNDQILLFSLTCLLTGFITWFLMHVRWEVFIIVPLGLLFVSMMTFGMPDRDLTYGLLLAYAVILFTVGMLYMKSIYQPREKALPSIDWFTILGFMTLYSLHGVAGAGIIDQVLPDILIVVGLILQKNRVGEKVSKWVLFVAVIYTLKPYYTLLDYFVIPDIIETKLYVLPWIVMASLLKKAAGKKYKTTTNYIQWGVLLIVATILVVDGLNRGTISDALIIGTLALISMLAGMYLRIKSYFFVGLSVLLLNVLMQTRPFWGNMPWWMYLLIVGALLIIVASTNEWYKQKKSEGKVSFVKKWYEKVVGTIKNWD